MYIVTIFLAADGRTLFKMSEEQLAEVESLENDVTLESRKMKRKKFSSTETLSDESDLESDYFDIEDEPVLDPMMRPMALTARLVSYQLSKRSF